MKRHNNKLTLFFRALLAVCLCFSLSMTALAGSDDGKRPTKISVKGAKNRTVYTGQEFTLKVKHNHDDDYLKWSINKKGIIAFEDTDRSGDDAEFYARKTGTVKVTCKIKGTKKKVTFKIKVKQSTKTYRDDDDDDDD